MAWIEFWMLNRPWIPRVNPTGHSIQFLCMLSMGVGNQKHLEITVSVFVANRKWVSLGQGPQSFCHQGTVSWKTVFSCVGVGDGFRVIQVPYIFRRFHLMVPLVRLVSGPEAGARCLRGSRTWMLFMNWVRDSRTQRGRNPTEGCSCSSFPLKHVLRLACRSF